MITVGFVGGFGGQAKRLISALSNLKFDLRIEYFEHQSQKRRREDITVFGNIERILEFNAVIIASPTNTHFNYLKYLFDNNYKGYIFCEKPPASHIDEVIFLENELDYFKNRTLFGYNLRFSILKNVLTGSAVEFEIGKLLRVDIVSGHGLGFKKEYKESWRNQADLKCGIFETVGIHYIDLMLNIFGKPQNSNIIATVNVPNGRVYDNFNFCSQFGNTAFSMFLSYTTPLIEQYSFVFEDGIINISDNTLKVWYPRDTFDERGFFAPPPLMINKKIASDIWQESIDKEMEFFIKIVKSKEKIDEKFFYSSIESNKILYELCDGSGQPF